jgi:hypothetical protein
MNPMFAETLGLHWKVARWPLVPFVLLGFGVPLLALRVASGIAERPDGGMVAIELLGMMELWNPVYPLLASLLGVTVALTAWTLDHRGGHVYALSLPLPRWRYALLKLAAGGAVLLVPVLALWAGAWLGSVLAVIPEGLQAYPHAFAFRFLLAALVVYAATFALAAGTMRTAVLLISALVLFLVFGTFAADWVGTILGIPDMVTPLDLFDRALLRWPGPFHVLGGNWSLIDV